MERRMAYGFKVATVAPDSCTLVLAAFHGRPIEVVVRNGKPVAEIVINGKRSILEKIFVVSSGGVPWPRVTSVTLYGRDVATGREDKETIVER